jgi:hypothetical protein
MTICELHQKVLHYREPQRKILATLRTSQDTSHRAKGVSVTMPKYNTPPFQLQMNTSDHTLAVLYELLA